MILVAAKELPFVSIVIPTFNRAGMVSRCIKNLLELDYPSEEFEIIIIDDGSRDDTGSVLSNILNLGNVKVKYLRNEQNQGAGASRNMGFRQSTGDLIACLDDDCLVERSWLRDFVETFNKFSFASAVGGSVINPTDSSLAQASHILEFSSWLPLGKTRRVHDIPACNIAYKRPDIEGFMFPESLKGSVYEDALFNHALSASGRMFIFNPEIKVYHYKWPHNFTKKDFYESQKRYATGFLKGGFKAHGVAGRLLIKYRVFNLLCLRLILVFFRCAKSKTYLLQFIRNFRLILCGEWFRNKVIFRGQL
jgi:glycosyltransferase involved in cell wall biosynthesis